LYRADVFGVPIEKTFIPTLIYFRRTLIGVPISLLSLKLKKKYLTKLTRATY
jgi:hypothetical protein